MCGFPFSGMKPTGVQWLHAPQGRLELNEKKKEMFLHLIEPRSLSKNGWITSVHEWNSDNLYPTNPVSSPSISRNPAT